jgi:hypothetical protein
VPKVYQNLSGTTKDSFKIGKNGPEIIRGYGEPEVEATNGSLYVDQTDGELYQYKKDEWVLLSKDYASFHYLSLLAQHETIQHIATLMCQAKEKSQFPWKVTLTLFGLFAAFAIPGVILIWLFFPD